ncbi:hypothetical protein N7522_008946 [Penicillium canescens]|nr:hypothetical protein N7522_008946 [Penicillium canescens]KAJ6176665.1 hypothetical protein N7485_003579 [Penicillium canescens]
MADAGIAGAQDLESKIDKMRRLRDLDAYTSPLWVTLQAKQKSLPVKEEFEYKKADPFNSGINSPTRYDLEMASCVVRGTIPLEIDGTFYRVTCDPIFANRNKKDIWINGDGAIDAWRISNGVVNFRQKYVRTPRFVIERTALRVWDATRSPVIHVSVYSDRTGIYDFDGQLTAKTYTAHLKVDVLTGETMAYGMEATGLGSNASCTTDLTKRPNTFGVLPRRNPKPQDVRWFTTLKNHFFGHLANHFEGKDGCIYLDTFLADGATLNVSPNMHPELDAGKAERQIKGKFVRLRIDPHAESTELELPVVLSDIIGEMPRCDDWFTTRPYNNAFGTRFTPKGFDAILHIDIAVSITHIWEAGESFLVGEPCFVPRAKDYNEGDGYLVVCARDTNTRLASLVILDATNVAAGPLSIIELPVVLCEGVHGNWVDASEIPVRRPLVDYSGVTPELLAKFGTGAPKTCDKLIGHPVKLTR